MITVSCTECSKEFSSKAESCPECGCPAEGKDFWSGLKSIEWPTTITLIFFLLLVCFVLINVDAFFPMGNGAMSGTNLAQLGDFWGGMLNPLLSFISIILLISTLRITQRGIEISKRELRLSTQEMKKSSAALQEQAKGLEQQNFDSKFFQMLKLYNDNANAIKIYSEFKYRKALVGVEVITGKGFLNADEIIEGRDVFELLTKYQISELDNLPQITNGLMLSQKIDFHWESSSPQISSYQLTLTTILSYLHMSNIEDKRFYYNILKAQMSDAEVLYLFYFLLASYGDKDYIGFKDYEHFIVSSDLFDHLDFSETSFAKKYVEFIPDILLGNAEK